MNKEVIKFNEDAVVIDENKNYKIYKNSDNIKEFLTKENLIEQMENEETKMSKRKEELNEISKNNKVNIIFSLLLPILAELTVIFAVKYLTTNVSLTELTYTPRFGYVKNIFIVSSTAQLFAIPLSVSIFIKSICSIKHSKKELKILSFQEKKLKNKLSEEKEQLEELKNNIELKNNSEIEVDNISNDKEILKKLKEQILNESKEEYKKDKVKVKK